MAGILLGVETGIPRPVQEAFKATGTAHIVAISGFNFAVIAGMFSSLFGHLLGSWRRFLAAGLSADCIAVYALLVGGSASVVRAAVMGGLSLSALIANPPGPAGPAGADDPGRNTRCWSTSHPSRPRPGRRYAITVTFSA